MINKIYIGYDHRQPVSYTTLCQSIIDRTSKPVSITPLQINTLPIKRCGLTPFTFSRFLVPYLNNYEGWALFMDIDMLILDDISKLFDLADDRYTVMVSKNKQRFEWASLMLMNCARCKVLTPEYIEAASGLHMLDWCKEEDIGDLPPEWNHLVGYDEKRNDAKGVHYTQGVPAYPETQYSEYAKEWHKSLNIAHSTLAWDELMAKSVHAVNVEGTYLPRFLFDEATKKPKPSFEAHIKSLLEQKRGVAHGNASANEIENSG